MPMITALQRANPGYEGQEVTKAPPWHNLVVADVACNSLSTGLFLFVGLGELAAPHLFTPLAWLAYPVALVILLVDLSLLVLDLGDPLRFHHMLRVFKPSSPMSFGVWALSAYSVPALVVAVLSLVGGGETLDWVRKGFMIAGLPLALLSAAYKGVLFSTTSQPGWRDARWLGAYLTTSAFALGAAEALVLALVLGHAPAVAALRHALALMLALMAVPLCLLLLDLRTVLAARGPNRLALAFGIDLGGGVVLPVILLLAGGLWTALVAVGLVFADSLAIRYEIVHLPHRAHH